MSTRYILSKYIEAAMSGSVCEQLEDSTFAGRIPLCPGVIAFGVNKQACKIELQSTFEEWLLLGLKLGHSLPVLSGIDLNTAAIYEPTDAL